MSITDALIDNFYNEILKYNEKKLLELAFKSKISQDELNHLLSEWDIEVKGAQKSALLSYIMKEHPELSFRPYEEPRLKGLLKYLRFENLRTISHYAKIGRALNKEGIIPLIFKGGAMKYLRGDLPRIMGDIDILVDEKDFLKCAKIAAKSGYWYSRMYNHSFDLHPKNSNEGAVDVHRFINMNTGYEKCFTKGLFKRCKKEKVFGVETFVPCYEDLMFITLINLAKNLREKTSEAGLLYALFDCKFFLDTKKDFNWKILTDNARKTKTEVQINFAIKFISKICPDIFPLKIQKNSLFEKETCKYSNIVMFNRFYLEGLREKCRPIKFLKIFKDLNLLKEYIKLKPRYFLLKMLRNHSFLIEILIKDLKQERCSF